MGVDQMLNISISIGDVETEMTTSLPLEDRLASFGTDDDDEAEDSD